VVSMMPACLNRSFFLRVDGSPEVFFLGPRLFPPPFGVQLPIFSFSFGVCSFSDCFELLGESVPFAGVGWSSGFERSSFSCRAARRRSHGAGYYFPPLSLPFMGKLDLGHFFRSFFFFLFFL